MRTGILACAEGALKRWTARPGSWGTSCATVFGACIGDCPTGALKIVEREADEFRRRGGRSGTDPYRGMP